jgi:hypothetical protein
MHRRAIVLSLLATILATIAVAGCGGGAGPTGPATGPATSPETTPKTTGGTVSIFLVKNEVITQVGRDSASPSAEQALNELLQGPTAAEKTQGYSTAVPAGTKLQGYSISGDTATVDFSKEMLDYGGGSARIQAITSQIDNTVISNDVRVKTVAITINGTPAEEVLQP